MYSNFTTNYKSSRRHVRDLNYDKPHPLQGFMGRFATQYQSPLSNWEVKHDKDGLVILKDTYFDMKNNPLPSTYAIFKNPIVYVDSLKMLSEPISMLHLYVVLEFPTSSTTLVIKNKDIGDCKFSPYEKTNRLKLDPNLVTLQHCYEGKYLRIFKMRGKVYITSLTSLDVSKSLVANVHYHDVFRATGINIDELFRGDIY